VEWRRVPDGELRRFTERPEIAYGSTLLVAAAWKRGLLALQLGDGDLIRVDDYEVRRLIDPSDDDGPATDSLCDKTAVDKFRVYVDRFDESSPSHVMLRTDGWMNSFENDGERLNADLELVKCLDAEGPESFAAEFPAVLSEMSQTGWSRGDDISCAVLYQDENAARKEVAL
jgi:hypothetical protein